MDWQAAIRARLVAAATPAGSRVYWVTRPQGSGFPAITLQTVSEQRPQHMKGFDGLNVTRLQIDCWSESYGEAQAVKEAAIAAVIPEHSGNGVKFSRGFVDAIRDLSERTETKFIYRASIDVILHHSTV